MRITDQNPLLIDTFSISDRLWKSCRLVAWCSAVVVTLIGIAGALIGNLSRESKAEDVTVSLKEFVEHAILVAQKGSTLPLNETLRDLGRVKRPANIDFFVFNGDHIAIYSSRVEMGLGLDFGSWLVSPDLTLERLVEQTPPGGSLAFHAQLQPLKGWKPRPGRGYVTYIPGSSSYIVAHAENNDDPTDEIGPILSSLRIPAAVSAAAGIALALLILLLARQVSSKVNSMWENSVVTACTALNQAIAQRSKVRLPSGACKEMKAFFYRLEALDWQIRKIGEQESHLQMAEYAARGVLNGMDRAVFVLDREGIILWANHTASKFLEVSNSAMLNTPIALYSGEAGGEIGIQSGMSAAWEGQGGVFVWSCRKTVSGVVVPVEVWANRLALPATEAMCIAIQDISAQRKNEAELKRTVQDLQTAMEREYASERAQRMFIAKMSHEIRAPLNAVIGLCQLERGDRNVPQTDTSLQRIEVSTRDLLRVIDDMLECAKLEQGKIPLLLQPFAPDGLMHEVRRFCHIRAAGRPLHFETKISDEIPEVVMGDSGRIKQVLINFCENAIKFTQAGVISLDVLPGIHDSTMIHFRVVDMGIGIAPSKQHQLFQEFSQADQMIGRVYGGSGLGLAICKMLVHAMDGRIGFESLEGKGSTFWFELPLPEGRMTLSPPDVSLSLVNPARQLAGRRILVVDDEDINRSVMTRLLAQCGCHSIVCSDGTGAFEKVLSQDFDLAILDLEMPETDGFRVLESIRRLPGHRGKLPAVAMSSHLREYVIDQVLGAGFLEYVTKPVEQANLVPAMLRALGDGSQKSDIQGGDGELLETSEFDRASGLLRLGNDLQLYDALTKRFRAAWCSDPDHLAVTLRSDSEASIRIAHKLRGAAALIGANEVAALAGAIEANARKGESSDAEIADLVAALERISSLLVPSPRRALQTWEPADQTV